MNRTFKVKIHGHETIVSFRDGEIMAIVHADFYNYSPTYFSSVDMFIIAWDYYKDDCCFIISNDGRCVTYSKVCGYLYKDFKNGEIEEIKVGTNE